MPKLRTIRDIKVKNKRVLMRVDFNVPTKEKLSKVEATIPTIKYLIKQKAKIILISHLDRPKGIDKKYSLRPIAKQLEKFLKRRVAFNKNSEDIVMLENVRFNPGEEKNDPKLAKKLARLGDIYINEAFAVSHRKHASIVGIPKYLPSAAGLLFEKEVQELNKVLQKPERPLVIIIGGAKVATKIKVIEKFLKKADKILIAGTLPNTIFAARGMEMGKSVVEKEVFGVVKKLDLENPKLQLPVDFVAWSEFDSEQQEIRGLNAVRENESIFDIGPRSIELFLEAIRAAKMIVWNGPLGMIEKKPFDRGSEFIAEAIARSRAYSIVGGGDTVAFIRRLDLEKKFNYVSTGGGAMLEYLANETLPGIKALCNGK